MLSFQRGMQENVMLRCLIKKTTDIMKRIKLQLLLLLGLFSLSFIGTSCNSDDDDNQVLYENCPFVGRWYISSIEDEEGNMSDYPNENRIVIFHANGRIEFTPFMVNVPGLVHKYESSDEYYDEMTYRYNDHHLVVEYTEFGIMPITEIYTYSFSDNNKLLRLKRTNRAWEGIEIVIASELDPVGDNTVVLKAMAN